MIQNPFSLIFDILGVVFHHIWLWGWVFLPILLAPFLWDAYMYHIRIRTLKKFKWQMLEFRLPPDVEKSPLAMEQVLAILQSTLFKGGWWKRYV